MTIASEITRLQGAKATARTSIINKGVDVPVSASVEDYHTYIDQINAGGVFMDSLKLAGYMLSGIDDSPHISGFTSWEDNNAFYGGLISAIVESSSNYLYFVGVKKTTGGDMQYYKNQTFTISGSYFLPRLPQFYKKNGAVRVFFSCRNANVSSNWNYWYQADWDLSNNQVTMALVGRNESETQLPPEADTTGYTQITENSWIKSISGESHSDDAYIFITTK